MKGLSKGGNHPVTLKLLLRNDVAAAATEILRLNMDDGQVNISGLHPGLARI